MSVDKALYALPMGMEQDDINDELMEVIISDNDADFEEDSQEVIDHNANLADHLDDSELARIGNSIIDMYRADKNSRAKWEKAYQNGLDLLGLEIEERSEPWPGACGVFHPLLTESVVRFQSHAIMETFPPSGPVKTKIVGKSTSDKEKQAARIREDMNYIITEEMHDYRNEHERMLFNLPLCGSAFKKTWFDPVEERPVSEFIAAEDVIVPYGATSLKSAPRITHVMREPENEIRKRIAVGFYKDIGDIPRPEPDYSDTHMLEDDISGVTPTVEYDDRLMVLECHVDKNLPAPFDDPSGISRPYVVTVLSDGQVLSIRRNWLEDDQRKCRREHFVHYFYLPGLGFYGIGLIHLIGGITKSATSLLRQLVDAGTLANLPGGFKTRGFRVKGEDHPIRPGEWRDVDIPGDEIRKSLMPLPYKEPSAVLFQLLQSMTDEGRRIGSIADVDISQTNKETPVGTTLALMERSMKVMSAVQARIHASMGSELKMIARLVRDYMPKEYPFETDEGFDRSMDYDGRVDVVPVSDPNASTMAQKVVQYQVAMEASARAPGIYDMKELHRGMLDVMQVKNSDKIIPMDDDMKPRDAVAENMALLGQEPVKVFDHQDHEAHIVTHMAMAQDPRVLEIVGQSPNANAIKSALAAHVTEHVSYAYRRKMEMALGTPLPNKDSGLPPDVEANLSPLIAQAAQKVLQQGLQEKQAEKNKQAEDDPLIQIQKRELAIKERKQKFDEEMKREEMKLERDKLNLDRNIEGTKIIADIVTTERDTSSKEKIEGLKAGVKVVEKIADVKLSDSRDSKANKE